MDSDCVDAGLVVGFSAEDVKFAGRVGGQEEVEVVGLEDFAKVCCLYGADGAGELECFSGRVEGPSDVFCVVDVAVEVDGAVWDLELFGFGVRLLGCESFEGCRDCFGAGWDKVEVDAKEVSGAVGGFLWGL